MICTLCPRNCGAERTAEHGSGFCGMPAGLRVARAMLHQWEEPPISGTNGAGTVFFSGCTLRCCYCQNGSISAGGQGKDISTARLREIFDELISRGHSCPAVDTAGPGAKASGTGGVQLRWV